MNINVLLYAHLAILHDLVCVHGFEKPPTCARSAWKSHLQLSRNTLQLSSPRLCIITVLNRDSLATP